MNQRKRLWRAVMGACAATMIAACGADLTGTYVGEATESGVLVITVPATGAEAKNETSPKTLADQTVTINTERGIHTLKFGSCTLKGDQVQGKSTMVKGQCDVKITGYEGPLPMSALITPDGDTMIVEVAGNAKNDTTTIKYAWNFKGKKK